MAGDITRSTFDPKKGYTSVRMQQGRLQLDADWNEQADIQNYLRQSYVTDMIGAGSGASKVDPFTGDPSDTSFQLRAIATAGDPSVATDIALLPGHFYTRGVLCELAPESRFTVRKLVNQRLQISPSLTIDGRRLQVGDWLVLANNTADANPSASQGADNGEDAAATSSEQPSPHETSDALASDEANDQTEETNGTNSTDPSAPLIGWRIKEIIDQANREIEVEGALDDVTVTQMRRIVTYTSQPDYPLNETSKEFDRLSEQRYFAYLDVWERPVTAVDDPTLREVALNVPDTTTRTKTVWQIKLQPALVKDEPSEPGEPVKLKPLPDKEITVPVVIATDLPQPWRDFEQIERERAPMMNACARLCPDSTTGTNGRLGNYLYRVEIHQGNDPATAASNGNGNQAVTFKWSRNNGSVVSPVKAIKGNVIRISKSSQDAWADSTRGQWLELLTTDQELRGEPGRMVPLRSATDTNLEFDDALIVGGSIPENVSKVRRWDHTVTDTRQGILAISSNWVELENGIKVQFALPNNLENPPAQDTTTSEDDSGQTNPVIYRTGDYWLIPSRAATNDIEWPSDRADDDVNNQGGPISRPLPQPPNGIEHQYALLAVVDFASDEPIPQVYDQRILFPPLLRALDRAGGVISGDLTIQQDLTVDQTTTTRDLKVTGQFGSTTFRAQRFEMALDPLDPSAPNYGVIKVSQGADANQVEFQSLENSDFVFRDGKVGIGKAPEQDLDVEGTVDAVQLTQGGKSVALQESLDSHIADNSNPHQVTAQQINNRDSGNQIVAQINDGTDSQDRIREGRIDEAIARQSAVDLAINTVTQQLEEHVTADNPHNITAATINVDGNGIVKEINKNADDSGVKIDARQIDNAIARTTDLTLHTGNSQNPHKVTAEQIDQNDGPHSLATQINAGTGIIEEKNIASEIARTIAVNDVVNRELQTIRDDFLPRTGGTITGSLEMAQLRVGANPPLPNQAKAYIQDDLYVGGGIFAGRLEAENIQSNNFIQLSSEALKEDISDLSSQEVAEGINKLHPVRFRYKQNPSGQISTGFLAEEVPDFLATPDHKGVKLMDVIALLTKAVQEHRHVVKQLSTKLKKQDQEIAQLKQSLSNLIPPDS